MTRRTKRVALAIVAAAALIAQVGAQQLADLEKDADDCVWTKLVYTPFVPKTDFYLVNNTLPLSCNDRLLPQQQRFCRRCKRQTSRAACLSTIADSWYDGSDLESCTWNGRNSAGERTREFNFTLGINNPNMFSDRVDARVCAITHEYRVASPQYSMAYFSAMSNGEVDELGRRDGAWLPGGWQPDASCIVKPPATRCNFTLHHSFMLQWTVSMRDIWTEDKGIIRQLDTPGNEQCLNNKERRCVAANPPFRYSVRLTEHPCKGPGASNTRGNRLVRSGGTFPMAQPGYLLYPGDNPKTYRETGFELEGLTKATWVVRAEQPVMVMVAPRDVALTVCPPGTEVCDYWTKVFPKAYPLTRCYFSKCKGTILKPATRQDVLLIVYPRFKADETVDPLATAPQVVFANVTGWRGTIQEARQIPTRR